MTRERWQEVERVLGLVLEAPAPGRAGVLSLECGGDEELHSQVNSLLEAHEEAENWKAPPQPEPAGGFHRIGLYQVEKLLGRGGMGAVYLAHRADGSFEQKVALKVIGLPLELEAFRDRFRRERQILANLNHPHITHLIDGGVTTDGQLYLAMEYVDGEAINAYVRNEGASEEAKLALILQTAEAVAYAHRNLVVHRDLKPANILVSREGAVKLLDFGVAKLMDPAVTSITATGLGMLTLQYASPEQIRGEAVTTLSDVYSLGLILHELVGGEPAFGSGLSARIGADGTFRSARMLTGDLGSITSKATAVDPSCRYSSVENLAADIRRYLTSQPVEAAPPSFLYRCRKFVSRNWRTLSAAVTATVLFGGLLLNNWRSRLESGARFEQSRSMANYLLFDLYNQVAGLHGSTAIRAAMASRAQLELETLSASPRASLVNKLERAAAHNRLADIYGVGGSASLGDAGRATENMKSAKDLLEQILAEKPNHREALMESIRNRLLEAKWNSWQRRSPAQAKALLDSAAKDLETLKAPSRPEWLRLSSMLALHMADTAEFTKDYAGEYQVATAALAQVDAWPPAMKSGEDYAILRNVLFKRKGNALYYQRKWQDSLEAYIEGAKVVEEYDRKAPGRADVQYAIMDANFSLAYGYMELKRMDLAAEAIRRSTSISAKMLEADPGNQSLRRSYWNQKDAMSQILTDAGKYEEAAKTAIEVVGARRAASKSSPNLNGPKEDLAYALSVQGSIQFKQRAKGEACHALAESVALFDSLSKQGGLSPKNETEHATPARKDFALCR